MKFNNDLYNGLPEDVIKDIMQTLNRNAAFTDLVDEYTSLIKRGAFAQAMRLKSKLIAMEEKLVGKYLEKYYYEVRQMDSLLKDMTEDEHRTMNNCVHGIIFMADFLETLVMDANELLQKYHPTFRIEMFDKLVAAGKEAKKQVQFMGESTSMEYQELFADDADRLHDMVMDRIEVFGRKVDRANERKQKQYMKLQAMKAKAAAQDAADAKPKEKSRKVARKVASRVASKPDAIYRISYPKKSTKAKSL